MDRNTSYEDPFNDGFNIVISQTPEAKPLIIGTLNVFGTGSSTSLTNAFDDDLDIILLKVADDMEPDDDLPNIFLCFSEETKMLESCYDIDDTGEWGQCFRRKSSSWALDEIVFHNGKDIIKTLQPADLVQ
ncbi:Hypothetical predicted protein [Mytilus galloprovincialis]|uniref:Uncharacterized protein n=1 Tax=Mytilus galloprovincialis TaxID=29158 RepID=A0A8B6C1F8_MYTGA|nr:Hypothetical predicted protein [Mytilus galloprovincialis]